MKISLVEPFYSASHKQWADGLKQYSTHDVELLTLPGRHWKWRMHGGAVSLAKQFNTLSYKPDLILTTSMLDTAGFLALTRNQSAGIPVAVYFHENQLTYPWSENDKGVEKGQDRHYGFINYTSALAADAVLFNSKYHQTAFLEALPTFLKQFPDYNELETVETIRQKSRILTLGLDLSAFDSYQQEADNEVPVIVWNHRWEFDKAPEDFFKILFELDAEGIAYKLVVLGEEFKKSPQIFKEARARLSDRILHFGYAASFSEYATWLWRSDIAFTTSRQDFFGGSVVEAIYCNCLPLLPNRLAYPEHVPKLLHPMYLYQNLVDAKEKMKDLLSNYKKNKQINLNTVKYNWKIIRSLYDESFEKISFGGSI